MATTPDAGNGWGSRLAGFGSCGMCGADGIIDIGFTDMTTFAHPPLLEVDLPALRTVAAWARTLNALAVRAEALPSDTDVDAIASLFMQDWSRARRRSANRAVHHTREQALHQADRITTRRVDQYQLGVDVALEDVSTTLATANMLMGDRPLVAARYLRAQLVAMANEAQRTWDNLLTSLGLIQPWLRDHGRLAMTVPADGPTRFTPTA